MGSPRKSKHWSRARSLAQLNILCQRMSANPSEGSDDKPRSIGRRLGLQDSEIPPELESLSRLSSNQLRAAVEEAQERSAKNRSFLLEAGERGQELLQEEAALECRLEECHEELVDSAQGRHDSGGSGGGLEWSPMSSVPTAAIRQARRQLHLQQAEMQRIREQNDLLEEELEEREQAIKRRAAAAHSRRRSGPSMRPSEQERNNQEVFQHVSLLTSEVAEASSNVGHASDTCNRERAELERELEEVRRQTSSMRAVLERHIEAARERNAEMQTELQSARALRTERSLPLHTAINFLKQELQDVKSTSEEADNELAEARREVATAEAEAGQHKSPRPGLAVTLQLPHPDLNSREATSDEESAESEVWDANADAASDVDARSQSVADAVSQASERDRDSVSSRTSTASQLGQRHKNNRREALKQRRNAYNTVEVVVNSKDGSSSTAQAEAAAASAAEASVAAAAAAAEAASAWGAWGFKVGASALGDALLKFDQYVAKEDEKRGNEDQKLDTISENRDSVVDQGDHRNDKKNRKGASDSRGSTVQKL